MESPKVCERNPGIRRSHLAASSPTTHRRPAAFTPARLRARRPATKVRRDRRHCNQDGGSKVPPHVCCQTRNPEPAVSWWHPQPTPFLIICDGQAPLGAGNGFAPTALQLHDQRRQCIVQELPNALWQRTHCWP